MNRRFATVAPTIWTSGSAREWRRLGPQYHVLALYLITNPHANIYGLYYLPSVVMVEETGLQRATCAKILQAFAAQDYAFYDERTEWAWIKNMAARQLQFSHAPSPRDLKLVGVRRFYSQCDPNPFLGQFYDHYHELFHLETRRDGGPWTLPKATEALTNGTRAKVIELFERWWPHYPKPVSKKAALAEWLKITPLPDEAFTQQAIDAVERQKRTKGWIEEGGKWIPDPERWLKKGRWDDRAPELPHVSEQEADVMATYGSLLEGGDGDPEGIS